MELDDSNLYKKWLSLGFDKKAILAAASCLKKEKASIKKLDSLLLELFSFKKFSEKEILDFDKSKKDMRDLAIEINNSLGVFVQYLDPEISTYIVKWISLGFDRDVLIKIAEYCFAHDLRSLAKMDETVAKFANYGIFTARAYGEFFAELLAKDEIIARTLDAIGLDRRVNNYDRKQYSTYEKMVKELKNRGITVITHIIIGLPNETKEDILKTVDFAVENKTDGVKLQLLHILKDTELYEDYKKGHVKPLTIEEYMDILFACIERIPENVVIHRITGDAPKKLLVEPLWSADKKMVLNTINKELEKRDIIQGKCSL